MTPARAILVIEDESLIAMMLEDFLDLLGHRVVGTIDSVEAALPRIGESGADAAILDVNLRDGPCWPVAGALRTAGVPFVIATGGHVEPPPPEFAAVPTLPKPFTIDGVRAALEKLGAISSPLVP